MRSCYRSQRGICSKKEEDIPIIKNREGEVFFVPNKDDVMIYLDTNNLS